MPRLHGEIFVHEAFLSGGPSDATSPTRAPWRFRPSSYVDVASLAAHLFSVPIALVSLMGKDKQVFKARYGLDVCETSRDVSFCSHAVVRRNEVFVVPDAGSERRFSSNPMVTGRRSSAFTRARP